LHHKSTADDDYHIVTTSVTSHTIEGLNPNTQYIVYVTAVSEKGQSLPSETLIAWTDPAYPAFVEVRLKLKSLAPSFVLLQFDSFTIRKVILFYKIRFCFV
jgi:hypothetical protein